ncbi:MAG TPA: CPBP family intramembrane glutamic endopeptidase [Candidatus Eisenbacteria bacterium]
MKVALAAVLAYIVFYGASVAVLARDPHLEAGETLGVLLVFGLGFSFVAWLATRGATPRRLRVRSPGREMAWLALLLVGIGVGFLGPGLTAVRAAVPTEPSQSIALLAAKLVVLVVLPALVFRWLGYTWRELFAFASLDRVERRALVILMAATALLQGTVGRGPRAIAALMAERGLPAWELGLVALPVWAWLTLEAGLTEEFLFRVLLQSRLAAWLKSETAGVIGMALLFGLAHAPGYVLRGAHVAEGMTGAPSALSAVAYATVVVSPLGLMFGVLWARTRNLALVVVLHGFADLIPNLAPMIRAFSG